MSKKVEATLVRSSGEARVVKFFDELVGSYKQVIISKSHISVNEGETQRIDRDILDRAIPFGILWEDQIKEDIKISKEAIIKALYDNGIYTVDEFEKNAVLVKGIVNELAAPILVQLISIIRFQKSLPHKET